MQGGRNATTPLQPGKMQSKHQKLVKGDIMQLEITLSISLVGESIREYRVGYADKEFVKWIDAVTGKTLDELFGEENILDIVVLSIVEIERVFNHV